ncbi:MAG TPA: transporter, partial [Polyangia bacterium]
MSARRLATMALFAFVLHGGIARAQADLGHRTLGTLGLDAGTVQSPGLYAVDAVGSYRADELVDRNGHRVPIDVEASAFSNVFGVNLTWELPRLHTSIAATVTVPVSRVSLATDDPRASLDDFGLGDVYVQPISLGWRPFGHELSVGYAFYAPTGQVAPGGLDGVGDGQWTHEFSTGGTIFFDHGQRWKLSALASYELHQRKLRIDITRGDSVQIQGGVGARLARVVDLGVAGYALWQVLDDRGSA